MVTGNNYILINASKFMFNIFNGTWLIYSTSFTVYYKKFVPKYLNNFSYVSVMSLIIFTPKVNTEALCFMCFTV